MTLPQRDLHGSAAGREFEFPLASQPPDGGGNEVTRGVHRLFKGGKVLSAALGKEVPDFARDRTDLVLIQDPLRGQRRGCRRRLLDGGFPGDGPFGTVRRRSLLFLGGFGDLFLS
jgi:hypothetical protein